MDVNSGAFSSAPRQLSSLFTASIKLANTSSAVNTKPSESAKQMFLVIALIEVFLSIAGVVGNSLTFAAVTRNKKLQIVTNFYVVSLSIADLSVSVMVVPFRVVENVTSYRLGYEWKLKEPLSEVVQFIGRTAQLVSLACLAAVSIDRLLALKSPLRYYTNIRHSTVTTIVVIAIIWIACTLLTCTPLIIEIPNKGELIVFVVYVFSVTLVICVSYCKIFSLMKKHSRNRKCLQKSHAKATTNIVVAKYGQDRSSSKTVSQDEPSCSNVQIFLEEISGRNVLTSDDILPENCATNLTKTEAPFDDKICTCDENVMRTSHSSQQAPDGKKTKNQLKKNGSKTRSQPLETRKPSGFLKPQVKERTNDIKLAITIAMVIGAFVVLVYPRMLFILYHTNKKESRTAMIVRPWLQVLLYTNIVCNPLLYAWRLEQFRKEFKQILFASFRAIIPTVGR